jgi:hypothetical protein
LREKGGAMPVCNNCGNYSPDVNDCPYCFEGSFFAKRKKMIEQAKEKFGERYLEVCQQIEELQEEIWMEKKKRKLAVLERLKAKMEEGEQGQ